MNRKVAIGLMLTVIVGSSFLLWQSLLGPVGQVTYTGSDAEVMQVTSSSTSTISPNDEVANPPRVEIVAENLAVPWEILFLPDGELLVTQRSGTIALVKQGIQIPIEGIEAVGEGGLLGAALHPNFRDNNLVYLFQTTETQTGLHNRIVRYELNGSTLVLDRVLVPDLPGARYHDGGRIAFGPDGYLYVTLGDAGAEPAAQAITNLAGSILRYTDDGEIPPGNPFKNAIYSYGHRNPQGLDWDEFGNLWSTEHGRSGAQSGFDELNLIQAGGNYGWPRNEGDTVQSGTIGPVRHSDADTTWAPGDALYHEGSIYIPGLRGETLYQAVLEGEQVVSWHEHFVGEYGRLRTIALGPDNLLYLTTSNRDGRGLPARNDDRIIRINPALLVR